MARYRTGNIIGSVVDLEQLSRGVWGRDGFLSTTACATTPGTGLQVAVSALGDAEAIVNGTLVPALAGGNVNLDAAHATLPRRDLIIYSTTGPSFTKLSGTPATNPALPTTSFDNATMLAIAEVYVGASVSSLVAADITDKRQHLNRGTDRLITSNTGTEYTTTSLTAADLVTFTGLLIPADRSWGMRFGYRKSAGAGAAAGIGLTINSTVVNEATTTAGSTALAVFGAQNEGQTGGVDFWLGPRRAQYQAAGRSSYSYRGTSAGGAGGSVGIGATALVPAVTITSITIRGITGSASVTLGVQDIYIWMEGY